MNYNTIDALLKIICINSLCGKNVKSSILELLFLKNCKVQHQTTKLMFLSDIWERARLLFWWLDLILTCPIATALWPLYFGMGEMQRICLLQCWGRREGAKAFFGFSAVTRVLPSGNHWGSLLIQFYYCIF